MGEKQVPMWLQLRRANKKFRALPLSERIESLIRAGVIKESEAAEVRARVAAQEAVAAPPPAAEPPPPS